jgi:hypothetical protein
MGFIFDVSGCSEGERAIFVWMFPFLIASVLPDSVLA